MLINIIQLPYYLLTTLLVLAAAAPSASSAIISGSTPYNPQDDMKYYFEAQSGCNYRFMSYTENCDTFDLWQGAGANQEIILRAAEGVDTWRLVTKCGLTIDYSTTCGGVDVGTASSLSAGRSDEWKLVSSGSFAEWQFEAINRHVGCQDRFLTYSDCNVYTLVLGDVNDGRSNFLMHPADSSSMEVVHHIASSDDRLCPDPFMWIDPDDDDQQYKMICTGGDLPLFSSSKLGREVVFDYVGTMLGPPTQEWASDPSNRWAPEALPLGNNKTLAIFSSPQSPNNEHRLGVVMSSEGAVSGKWDQYSASALSFGQSGDKTCDSSGSPCETDTDCSLVCKFSGNECSSHSDCGGGKKCVGSQTCFSSSTSVISNNEGGDIDAHFFVDTDGTTYLLWKTDDNAIGMTTTRLWINQVTISVNGPDFVQLVGDPVEILDSTGLWWVSSWVNGGSLIEGPQMIKRGEYYYLFFSAGRYCEESYSEGVARSTDVMGPYEKLGTPILSTGIVGVGTNNGLKLVGPGHASFVQDHDGKDWIIFHASEGQNCNRRPYAERLLWSVDGWPVVVFGETSDTTTPTMVPSKAPDNFT